jgi:predicted esterase
MMASYLTLSQDEPFHAMIGFSGRLTYEGAPRNIKTPICLIHGKDDVVVLPQESENFAKYCQKYQIPYGLEIIKNLSHSIDGKGLQFAIDFLNKYK